jgi:hypothetical protein
MFKQEVTEKQVYAPPSVTYIGEATTVILGLASIGSDLDGSWIVDGFEFQDNRPI